MNLFLTGATTFKRRSIELYTDSPLLSVLIWIISQHMNETPNAHWIIISTDENLVFDLKLGPCFALFLYSVEFISG